MSNNKQSSIEWLEDKLTGFLTFEDMVAVKNYHNLIEQAKAMHKEEMVDFGNDLLAQNDSNYIGMPNLAEQYYNITFGGNNDKKQNS